MKVVGGVRVCRNCGKPGHYAKTCPMNLPGTLPPLKADSVGGIVASAPPRGKEGGGASLYQRRCGICGKPGHYAKTCPFKKKQKSARKRAASAASGSPAPPVLPPALAPPPPSAPPAQQLAEQPAQQPVQQLPQPLQAPNVGGAPPLMLSAEILKRQQLHSLLFGGFAQYQGTSWQQLLPGTYGTITPKAAAPEAAPAAAPAVEPAAEPAEEQGEDPKLKAGHSPAWRMALAALAQGKAAPELSKSLEEAVPKRSPETLGSAPVTPPVAAPLMPPPAEGDSRRSRGQTYYCKFCRYEVSVRGNKTSKRPTFVCHHCPSKNYKLRRSNNAYLSKTGQEEVNVYDAVAQQEPNSVLGMKRTWSPEFLEARKRFKEAMATGAATGAGVLSGLPKGHPSGSPTQKGAGEPEGPPEGSETCALELLASATELLAELDSPRAARRARRGRGRPPAAGRA